MFCAMDTGLANSSRDADDVSGERLKRRTPEPFFGGTYEAAMVSTEPPSCLSDGGQQLPATLPAAAGHLTATTSGPGVSGAPGNERSVFCVAESMMLIVPDPVSNLEVQLEYSPKP